MSLEREKVRCLSCELMQWRGRVNCRRCGRALPEPAVQIVERVVENIVIRHEPQGFQSLDGVGVFPTMAEVERAMNAVAYQRANRKPLEAARLLGIGKSTLYRKLKEMRPRAE